ncbi:MAG: hypothetical protein V1735_04800 [Nanoarchaeota archaeon]
MRVPSAKGEVWVSVLLYFLIMAIVVALLLGTGRPILDRMRDRSVFLQMKDSFSAIDKQVEDVASEGPGSQRVIPLDVRKGKLILEDGKLIWEMETTAKLMEPRSKLDFGNMVISSDIDVSVNETPMHYLMENSYLQANISKYGNRTGAASINTSQLINWVEHLASNTTITGTFGFKVADDETTRTGTGWTELVPANATNVGSASVVVHMSTANYRYDLRISLDSKADFLSATVENLEAS